MRAGHLTSEMLNLKQATSSAIREQHHAQNAIDKNNKIYFALQEGDEDGYWQCNLPEDKTVGTIKIKVVDGHEDELSGATIFIGENKFHKIPKNLDKFTENKYQSYDK